VAERTLVRRRGQGLPASRTVREQVLLFRVGTETYALGMRALWEVLLPEGVTGLPTPPYQVCTALASRGRRLPLIRMSELFGIPSDRIPPGARVVLIQGNGRSLGLLVDEVLEMIEIEAARLAPVPRRAPLLDPGLFRGLFQRGERIILLLAEEGLGGFDEVVRFSGGSPSAERPAI
jgi:chemotaxis signal transduction protein